MYFMKTKFNFDGKIILITGGGSGIGLATALSFARSGGTVVINDISEEALHMAEKVAMEEDLKLHSFCCDITDTVRVDQMVERIGNEIGNIEILVNNAGIIFHEAARKMPMESFRTELEVDVVAPFYLTQKLVPQMIEVKQGKIINMCSVMSEIAREGSSAYAASKGALKMLTKGMAVEWAKYNIQVNGVEPGYVLTDQTSVIRDNDDAFYTFIEKRTPAGRWAKADDIAGPILFLASDAADFITGQMVCVDGGLTAYIGSK